MARPKRRQALTPSRYRRMIAHLVWLHNEYGPHLEVIIPFFGWHLAHAQERAKRITRKLKAGAPNVWTVDQLERLWSIVRARQIANPAVTIEEICRQLASSKELYDPDALDDKDAYRRGYMVTAHDPRSISGEEVYSFIDNPETLRRRYAEADQIIKSKNLETEFHARAEATVEYFRALEKRFAKNERK